MRTAYIGLGANLGQPAAQLRAALAELNALADVHVEAVSRFYRSAPMGPAEQPDYCNAVCRVRTSREPQALLAAMIAIEQVAGRVRDGQRWGPRSLDLDLLHVAGVESRAPGLNLPHPGIAQRNFVLVPLAEIEPDLQIPGLGAVSALAGAIGRQGLVPWRDGDDGAAP